MAIIKALGFFLSVLTMAPLQAPAEEVKSATPNILLIIADDCTYLDMEVYGGQAKTPRLKQLASEGMTFSRCFQTAPMCSPTRHNIYTGLYPVRSGAWPNHTRVYDGTRSIAHFLKESGYRVALSGKKHIGPGESFPFEYSGEFRVANPESVENYPQISKLMSESKKAGNPFCLIACSNEPHTPYTKGDPTQYPPDTLKLPPSWVDTPETRRLYSDYLAEITYFDQQCGVALDLLKAHGLEENTLVMVVSEQGSGFPFAKWTCYELGLASGMIIRWPGQVRPGSSSEALVEYVDITPTFIEAAGAAADIELDGKSFLEVLTGKTKKHKKYTFGLHTTRGIINGSEHYGIRSCGTSEYRYIRNLNYQNQFKNVVTHPGKGKVQFWKSWKLKAESGDPKAIELTSKYEWRPAEELYHVASDPHCLQNLVEDQKFSGIRNDLSKALDEWMKSQGDTGKDIEARALTRQARFNGPNVKKQTATH